VHVASYAQQDAGIIYADRSNFFAEAGRKVVAGVAAGGYVHPCGIEVFERGGRSAVSRGGVSEGRIRNRNFEINVFVSCSGWIVNHGFDADLIALFHAIAETGNLCPVGEFASRTENVFFLIGAEKIGAIFIPESDVMENRAGDEVARGVNQFCMISEKPAGTRDRPNTIWWLGGPMRSVMVWEFASEMAFRATPVAVA
jgi:hypothetical protein